jgi:hypothetical protein
MTSFLTAKRSDNILMALSSQNFARVFALGQYFERLKRPNSGRIVLPPKGELFKPLFHVVSSPFFFDLC